MNASIAHRRKTLTLLSSLAVLAVAVCSTTAEATVFTWRNTGTTWNTGTNWQNLSVPTSSSTNSLLFNGAGGGTVSNNIGGTLTQGSINFGASAGSYTLQGNAVGLGSITNASSNTQTFNLQINQSSAGTYDTTGKVVIGAGLSGSQSISKIGSGELELTTSGKLYTGTLSASDGSVRFTGSGFTNGSLALSGATNFASTGNSVVKDFTNTGSGNITIGEAGVGTLNTSNFDLTGFTGTLSVNSDAPYSNDTVVSNFTNPFGGNLAITLDYAPDIDTSFNHLLQGEQWSFFSAATSTGNFDTVTLTLSGSTYNLTNNGGFWTTTSVNGYPPSYGFMFSTVDTTLSIGGQSVAVTAGTLYAVPEPSTMVFAGIGAAMFGWQTWTGRRARLRRKLIESAAV